MADNFRYVYAGTTAVMSLHLVSALRPRAVTYMNGRVWIGNDQSLATTASAAIIGGASTLVGNFYGGSEIRPSGLYDQTDWAHPAVAIEPGLGGDVVAIFPLRGTVPSILVFKETAICVFRPRWGSGGSFTAAAGDTIDTVNSSVKVVSSSIGCAAQRTVREVAGTEGGDIWFLANDGHVRSLRRAEQDVSAGPSSAITWNQNEVMSTANKARMTMATAAVYDGKYYLSFPAGTSWTNDTLVVIDILTEKMLFTQKGTGSGGWESLYSGPFGLEGSVAETLVGLVTDQVADSGPSGAITGAWAHELEVETSDRFPGANTVTAQETSKSFHFGDMRRKKAWVNFSLMAEAASNATGSIDILRSVDGQDFTALGTVIIPQWSDVTNRRLYRQTLSMEDVPPGYAIQFRIDKADSSQCSLVYSECEARFIPDEQDNTIS
jgi:hypothetical protein